jgi:hypothetical protein
MITNRVPKRPLKYVGVFLVIVLVGSLFLGNSGVFTAVGFLLIVGAMLYLKQMEDISESTVAQRIKAEYSPETQPQVFEIYEHMKIKELEGLFLKILEDSHGDINKVKNLASLAESVGWRAFLENHW